MNTYIKTISISIIAVGIFFLFQINYVLTTFSPKMVIVPTLLSITIGFLWGKFLTLKQQSDLDKKLFEEISDASIAFTLVTNTDGSYRYVSAMAQQMTGYSVDDFYNDPALFDTLIKDEDLDRYVALKQHLFKHPESSTDEFKIMTKTGDVKYIKQIIDPIYRDGQFKGMRFFNIDISSETASNEKIEYLAYHDFLTYLPNRNALKERLDELTKSKQQQTFCMLFLDLNYFKYINDTLGHTVGDTVLKSVASRISEYCEPSVFFSRFGGDEFVFLIPDISRDQAETYAQHILDLIKMPFRIEYQNLHISGSIGMAFFPDDTTDPEHLLQYADIAMYKAKENDQQKYCFFDHDFFQESQDFLQTDRLIHLAIERKELKVYYQSKVNGLDEIIGLEALVRWKKPNGDIIAPDHFIPAAEMTGTIVQIGQYVQQQVLEDIKQWQEMGIAVPVAINVSARELGEETFIENLYQHCGGDENLIALVEIEITESMLIKSIDRTTRTLEKLQQHGFKIALDDFGTGYSSLVYIKQFPLDYLKLDRMLIADIEFNDADREIVRAVIQLAGILEIQTIAEGIERSSQAELLKTMGCTYFQGYYYSRPIDKKETTVLLEREVSSQLAMHPSV